MPHAKRSKHLDANETAEILRLYDQGLTDKEIAKRLDLPRASVRARKAHRTMGTYADAKVKTAEATRLTTFSWIPIYTELAKKILEFQNRQNELIEILKELKKENIPVISFVDRDEKQEEIPLTVIDPFTFFASFNRGLTKKNRQDLLAYLKAKFDLSSAIPTDFEGVPVVNALAARFFPWAGDRHPEDVPSLWALAEAVVAGPPENLDPKLFDRCLEIEAVGPAKLTMGMFWLNPKQYIAWDAKNRALFAHLGIGGEVKNFTTYLQLITDVNAKLGTDYPTISRMAWERSSKQLTDTEPRMWIEKTLVKDRPDREHGEHMLGKALWSPQRAKNGADIYKNMREVREGDIILHLIDNKQFSGVSLAAGSADDTFQGLRGTEWQGPAYRIPLRDYVPLDPPLGREDFLESPAGAAEFRKIHKENRGLFYTTELDLNQGKYLTPAPTELVEAMSRIYYKLYNKVLPHLEAFDPRPDAGVEVGTYSVDDAISGVFLDRDSFEEMLLLLGTKKNIILQGPPGVGKTFIARRLAYALLKAEDEARVKFLQFHQSYSYEDFIEGYRPKEGIFILQKGLFRNFCNAANEDSSSDYS